MLESFTGNVANAKLSFVRFEQEKPQCFANGAAWLRWFLTANMAQVRSGQFNGTQDQNIIDYVQKDAALYDCTHPSYHLELRQILAPFSLNISGTHVNSSNTLLKATNIDSQQFSTSFGAFIFAKKNNNNIGHVFCYGLRRDPAFANQAVLGFFDPNEGMLLLELDNFPPSPTGKQDILNEMQETFQVVPNSFPYQESLSIISCFLEKLSSTYISQTYDYSDYHTDLVRYQGEMVYFSPRLKKVMTEQNNGSQTPQRNFFF